MSAKKNTDPGLMRINLSTYRDNDFGEQLKLGDDYVRFGKEDDRPEYIQELYTNSTFHSRISKTISDLIYGQGLFTEDGKEPTGKLQEWLETEVFGMSGANHLKQIINNVKRHGYCFVEVIRNAKQVSVLRAANPKFWRSGEYNDDLKVDFHYFSDKFGTKGKAQADKHPAWEEGTKEKKSIYLLQLPLNENEYYADPDYWGAARYVELEWRLAVYHLAAVGNSFSPSVIMTLINGAPTTDAGKRALKAQLKRDLIGEDNAGKFLVNFSNGIEGAPQIEVLEPADLHQHLTDLSEKIEKNILVANGVTTPMLFGIKESGGLGNNKDEMTEGLKIFERNIIKPFRDVIEGFLNKVLPDLGVTEKVMFVSEEMEDEDPEKVEDKETKEEETEKLSLEAIELTDEDGELILGSLEYESLNEDWEVVDRRHYSEENSSTEDWASSRIKARLSAWKKLVEVVKSKPNGFSYLDKSFYKVRYEYLETDLSDRSKSRGFCFDMMERTDKGVVYRLEDIDRASAIAAELPLHKGKDFDMFELKGGLKCTHIWGEVLYRMKSQTDVIAKGKIVDSIPKSYEPKPRGHDRAGRPEGGRTDDGHHPNYKK